MKIFNKYILEAINKGIQIALDDYEDIDNGNSISSKQDVIKNEDSIKSIINFWDSFVDLGLPSGTLWAKHNLGVNSNKLSVFHDYLFWYGDYYQWGETNSVYNALTDSWTIPKEKFVHNVKEKYQYDNNGNNGLAELEFMDDPASVFFGTNKCHTPTFKQFEELKNNTNKKFIEKYNDKIGLNGLLLTSKINGNEIFFPANGFIDETGQREFFRDAIYCWSKNRISGSPYCFSYHNHNSPFDYISIDTMVPEHAAAIRPVYNK